MVNGGINTYTEELNEQLLSEETEQLLISLHNNVIGSGDKFLAKVEKYIKRITVKTRCCEKKISC